MKSQFQDVLNLEGVTHKQRDEADTLSIIRWNTAVLLGIIWSLVKVSFCGLGHRAFSCHKQMDGETEIQTHRIHLGQKQT